MTARHEVLRHGRIDPSFRRHLDGKGFESRYFSWPRRKPNAFIVAELRNTSRIDPQSAQKPNGATRIRRLDRQVMLGLVARCSPPTVERNAKRGGREQPRLWTVPDAEVRSLRPAHHRGEARCNRQSWARVLHTDALNEGNDRPARIPRPAVVNDDSRIQQQRLVRLKWHIVSPVQLVLSPTPDRNANSRANSPWVLHLGGVGELHVSFHKGEKLFMPKPTATGRAPPPRSQPYANATSAPTRW